MSQERKKGASPRKIGGQLLVAAVIMVLDRLMKLWIVKAIPGEFLADQWVRTGENIPLIPGLIHLTQIHNFGASFGILQNMRWPLLIITVLLMALVVWALFTEKVRHPTGLWALGLVLGGAVGNLIDRAALGYVVDMFEVEFVNFAVFNVADIFIVCGAILFAVYILFFESKESGQSESFRLVPKEEYEAQNREDEDTHEDQDNS